MDSLLLIISILVVLILSYIILKIMTKEFKYSCIFQNINNSLLAIHGYLSYTLIFFFAISLLYNSIFINYDIFNLTIGVIITLLYLYITINYIGNNSIGVFMITDIEECGKNLYLITLSNKDDIYEYYVNNIDSLNEGKSYKCKFNMSLKSIKKIINEVIVIDGDNNE